MSTLTPSSSLAEEAVKACAAGTDSKEEIPQASPRDAECSPPVSLGTRVSATVREPGLESPERLCPLRPPQGPPPVRPFTGVEAGARQAWTRAAFFGPCRERCGGSSTGPIPTPPSSAASPFPPAGSSGSIKKRRPGRARRFGRPCLGGVPDLSSPSSFFSALPPSWRSVSMCSCGTKLRSGVTGSAGASYRGLGNHEGASGGHPLKDHWGGAEGHNFHFSLPRHPIPQTSISQGSQ